MGDRIDVTINGKSNIPDVVKQSTDALNQWTNALRYTQEAAKTFGAAMADTGRAWLAASSSAEEYQKRLGLLNAQLNYTKAVQGDTSDSTNGLRFSLDSLKDSVLGNLGHFGAFMITLNSVFGVIGEITGVIGGAVDGFLQLAGTIGGVVVDAVRMAADEIGTLTQQVFELNKSTEQTTGSWRYIYGGQANAQDLMNWTSQFSMKVPYTRQDLMGAVTALGRMGLTEDQVKQYMATVADVGALNGQRDLTQAAWAVQGAANGRSMMLRYDYGITPEQLAQYGYDQSNPQATILPALQALLKARGLTGSAQWAATNTFWGAESSFVDRLQNFGLQVGGTNLSGDIGKGSMFGVLKKDLADISDWWDKHSKDINYLANLFGSVLGGAVKDATRAFQGLMDGLHASGLDKQLEWLIYHLGQWLNDPAVAAGIQKFTDAFGQLAGTGISVVLQAAREFFDGLASTGVPQALFNGLINVMNSMSAFFNNHRADIADFFHQLGVVSGNAIKEVGDGFKQMGESFKRFKDSMTPQDWENLKWFLSEATIGTIKHIADAFYGLSLTVSALVDELTKIKQLMDWINQHTGGAAGGWFGNQGGGGSGDGAGGGGGGGSGGRRMSDIIGPTQSALNNVRGSALVGGGSGGGNVSTTSSSTSNLYGGHTSNNVTIHAAAEAQIERIAKRVMAEADAAQNVFSRRVGGYRPGLFGSIG